MFKHAPISVYLHIILIYSYVSLCLTQYLPGKLIFYGRVYKSVAYVAPVRKVETRLELLYFFLDLLE